MCAVTKIKSNTWTFRTGILEGGWRLATHDRKEKKKGLVKICSKSMCTHNKGANEQTLKTELPKFHKCLFPVPTEFRQLLTSKKGIHQTSSPSKETFCLEWYDVASFYQSLSKNRK